MSDHEDFKAWLVKRIDGSVIEVVIGTAFHASQKVDELAADTWTNISADGPYDFTVAIRP